MACRLLPVGYHQKYNHRLSSPIWQNGEEVVSLPEECTEGLQTVHSYFRPALLKKKIEIQWISTDVLEWK
jgi:hypothetical protein